MAIDIDYNFCFHWWKIELFKAFKQVIFFWIHGVYIYSYNFMLINTWYAKSSKNDICTTKSIVYVMKFWTIEESVLIIFVHNVLLFLITKAKCYNYTRKWIDVFYVVLRKNFLGFSWLLQHVLGIWWKK